MEPFSWILFLGVVVVSWLLVIKNRSSSANKYFFPPGPRGIPLFGCPWIIFGELPKMFTKLGEKWGDIFTVNIFGAKMVILNSNEVIREAFTSPSLGELFSGRPPPPATRYKLEGSFTSFLQPTSLWAKQRKLIHKILNMYGDGVQIMEDEVHGELKHVCDWLNQNKDQPIDMDSVLYPSLINILIILLTGQRREYGSTALENVRALDEGGAEFGSVTNMLLLTVFPFLRFLPFGPGRPLRIYNDATGKLVKDFYHETKATFDPEVTRGMVDYLLHQQNATRQEDGSTWLSDIAVKATIQEVIGAGSITTRGALSAFFLIISQHSEVARRIQTEIQSVCPGRLPSLRDRSEMPYTMAAILELLRYISHVPLSVLRMTTDDVTFKGYRIPAKTTIVANLWNVHHYGGTWADPWEFRPERYFGEDGALLPADHNLRKSTMPFGIGRRACAGEAFAKSRLFLFVTTLLQKFNFSPDPSRPLPSCDPNRFKKGIVISPPRYFLKVTSR